MTREENKQLRLTACRVRQGIIEATHSARVKIDEEGGEAAAFTVIMASATAMMEMNRLSAGAERCRSSRGVLRRLAMARPT